MDFDSLLVYCVLLFSLVVEFCECSLCIMIWLVDGMKYILCGCMLKRFLVVMVRFLLCRNLSMNLLLCLFMLSVFMLVRMVVLLNILIFRCLCLVLVLQSWFSSIFMVCVLQCMEGDRIDFFLLCEGSMKWFMLLMLRVLLCMQVDMYELSIVISIRFLVVMEYLLGSIFMVCCLKVVL